MRVGAPPPKQPLRWSNLDTRQRHLVGVFVLGVACFIATGNLIWNLMQDKEKLLRSEEQKQIDDEKGKDEFIKQYLQHQPQPKPSS